MLVLEPSKSGHASSKSGFVYRTLDWAYGRSLRLALRFRVVVVLICVGVVLCAGGYPGHYETGKLISGWAEAAHISGVELFHAGTGRDGDRLVTAGGRVFVVTATAPTMAEAAARAYEGADAIGFEGKHFRRDIGSR